MSRSIVLLITSGWRKLQSGRWLPIRDLLFFNWGWLLHLSFWVLKGRKTACCFGMK